MAEAKPGTEVFSSAPTNSFYGLRVQFLPPKSELEKASGVTQSNLRQHFPLLHKNSSPPPRVQASSRDQETAGSVLHRTETLALGRHLGTRAQEAQAAHLRNGAGVRNQLPGFS